MEDEDEDDSCWVPISVGSKPSPSGKPAAAPSPTPTAASSTADKVNETATRGGGVLFTSPVAKKTTRQPEQRESLKSIQQKLEIQTTIKKRLVNDPIELLWQRFLFHLTQEFGNLDWHIRLALGLILLGICFRSMSLTVWCLCHPKEIFVALLFLLPFLYFDPFDLKSRFERVLDILANPSATVLEAVIDQLGSKQIRTLSLALLFVPTFLQVRTLAFLVEIIAEHGWLCVILATTAIFFLSGFLLKIHSVSPRDCLHKCLIFLYGSALFLTFWSMNIYKLPSLAGPFCFSTGTLLLAHYDNDDMEWFSSLIRQSLRLALRDMLASIGTCVQEDEMLQIAMLRWIVDFWSSTPSKKTAQSASPNVGGGPDSSTTPSSQRPTSSSSGQSADFQWEDLGPMLDVVTTQMTSEVATLQAGGTQTHSSSSSSSSNTTGASSTSPTGPNVASSSQRHSTSTARNEDDPLQNLRDMLAALSMDPQAEACVRAYRRAVEGFPPSREVAFFLSFTRRCPATVLFLWIMLFPMNRYGELLLLVPLMIVEAFRVHDWMNGLLVDEHGRMERFNPRLILQNVDPMKILLNDDDAHTRPTLLTVWHNVQTSVTSLESGLTAARVVHTGAVAAEFAGNVMSLAQLGWEVSQHGWLHGLGVLLKESVHHNQTTQHGRYTSAALQVIQSGQAVGRSLTVLSQDQNVDAVAGPLVGFLVALARLIPPVASQEESSSSSPQIEEQTPSSETAEAPASHKTRDMIEVGESGADGGENVCLSSVMELIATAYERGLIESDEKNSYLERLARSSEEEYVAGMQKSLKVLLENSDEIVTATQEDHRALQTSAITLRSADPSGAKVVVDPGLTESVDTVGGEKESCTKEIKTSDDGGSEQGNLTASSVVQESSESDQWVGLVEKEEGKELHSKVNEVMEASSGVQSASSEKQESDQEEDIWMKVGGGVAILGAIVGGVAVALASQNGNREDKDRQKSTVVIEEVSDE